MDIKINRNLYLQNEYQTKQNGTGAADCADTRRAVLERSADAFKQAAARCYDRNGKYGGERSSAEKDAEQAVSEELKSAAVMECIDTIKNLVTPEDYSQLEAWGLIPDEDNPEAFVSVYERIQIELAAFCDDYDISSLNISSEKMKSVLGSEGMANAAAMTKDISEAGEKLSDDAKKYILENELEPTLENVYKAVHSGTAMSAESSISEEDWQQLKNQVEKFFDTNGIENKSENIERAKWIISKNLPLNVENFTKLSALDEVDFGSESYREKLERNIAYTIYFGGEAMTADMTGRSFDTENIKEAVDTVQSAMDSDVDYILKNNRKLNIENLKLRIEERNRKQFENKKEENKDDAVIRNKILIEARAVLTSGSLFAMQKTGVNISYTEITVLVDMSVKRDNIFADNLFMLDGDKPTVEASELLTQTIHVMTGFAGIPVNVAGKIYSGQIEYTAQAVYNEGKLMMAKYSLAAERYETLGTQVRADLGDSIGKAFNNIDDILAEQEIEINDENRRAARILGYNSCEITKESVKAIDEIVDDLDSLVKNLTPRAAVYLIRNGINPLDTDIKELNNELVNINNMLGSSDDDGRYSEYLWKLEKNKNITKEERNAYVQLYRIIEHISRQDGRAAGAVAEAGQQMTLANLYSAVKTIKAGRVDRTVDDKTGLLDSGYSEDDLVSYMKNAAAMMDDDSLHGEYKYERMQQKLEAISQSQTMSEQELMRIVSGMEQVSVGNIYSAMVASDPHFYKMVQKLDDDKILKETDNIAHIWQSEDEISSEEQIVSSYMNLKVAAESENNETTYEMAVMRTDMRQAVSFMAGQAEKRSYYIPMEIGGDTTVVHMTFRQGNNSERGRISIYTQLDDGKISVLMCRQSEGYRIYAATDSAAIKEKLEMYMEEKVVVTASVTDGMWNDTAEEADAEVEETTYGELVRQAKSFLHNVLKNI